MRKRVFVLGSFASAVHAQWMSPHGEEIVKSIPVASEPHIFWNGDDADKVISQIRIPRPAGSLRPAASQFNGQAGLALDQFILAPLHLKRKDAWLCNLVPHATINSTQKKAIEKSYSPLVPKLGLPVPTIKPAPKILADDARRKTILEEINKSKAGLLILLGDEPLEWFLRHFTKLPKKLAYFDAYGRLYPVQTEELKLTVLPLAHPRQVANQGTSADRWVVSHQAWMRRAGTSRLAESFSA